MKKNDGKQDTLLQSKFEHDHSISLLHKTHITAYANAVHGILWFYMMFNSVLDPLVNEGLQTKRYARIRRKRSCMNAAERRGKRKQIFQLIWLYVKFVHFHLILTVKVYSKYFFEALKINDNIEENNSNFPEEEDDTFINDNDNLGIY